MKATLTIQGLYNYDRALFDGWALPDGVDRETLIDTIIYQCAGLELTLPNPNLFKRYSNAWSRRRLDGWNRALSAIQAEYNPIHNYDRHETYEDTDAGSSGANAEASGTNTETVAAFNSSSYSPKGKLQMSQESENSATYAREGGHTLDVSGNIGVTTSQQMVEAELDLSGRLDIYNMIATDFRKEFCLLVYY